MHKDGVAETSKRLVYYDVDQYGGKIALSPKSIFSAIHGALNGTIAYRHSENIVERLARVRLRVKLAVI